MTTVERWLANLAMVCCFSAALCAMTEVACAQSNSDHTPFPKVPSTEADDPSADDPPPMPHSQSGNRAKQNANGSQNGTTSSNAGGQRTPNRVSYQNSPPGTRKIAQAEYQSDDQATGPRLNSTQNGNQNRGANSHGQQSNGSNSNQFDNNRTDFNRNEENRADSQSAQARRMEYRLQNGAAPDNYQTASSYAYQTYPTQASYQGSANYGQTLTSAQQPKSGLSSFFGQMPWNSSSNNSGTPHYAPSRMNMAEATREPYVGPDAVYIDAESVPPGQRAMQPSNVRFSPAPASQLPSVELPGGAMQMNPAQGSTMQRGQMPQGMQNQMSPGMSQGQMPQRQTMPQNRTPNQMHSGPTQSETMPDGQDGKIVDGPDGQVFDGETMMDGDGQMMMNGYGPQMQRGSRGFLSPYCNDCQNGCCGGSGNRGGMWMGDGDDGDCGCSTCHSTGCSCDECPNCAGHRPGHGPYGRPWVLWPFDWLDSHLSDDDSGWWWGRDFTVFAGVHNFRSPVDLGINSNFGFQEGLNFSFPILDGCFPVAAQVGYQKTQSDLNPSTVIPDHRSQGFLTAGVFHRPKDCVGWDLGAVFDWLHDDFYQTYDVAQIRSEIGCWCNRSNEIGFDSSIGLWHDTTSDQISPIGAAEYDVIDQYYFFYRHKFTFGGDLRLGGGFTGKNGDNNKNCGLVGADFSVPLSCCLAVEGGFNYLMPGQSTTNEISSETWNVGINLVWYPGSTAKCCCSPYRPLLGVADNGSFFVTRKGTEQR